MRKPKNYILGEAVEGKWKHELLVYLGQQFNLDTLVETGSSDGGTLKFIYQNFTRCFTIELHQGYYDLCRDIFKNAGNVFCYLGDSATELRNILGNMETFKGLFWLDAHVSGPHTAHNGDPLPEEIKAIVELSPDSLIVIDDQKDDHLCQVPKEYYEGYTVEFRTGVVLLYKTGLYNIPKFE